MSREPDWATADGRVKLYLGDCLDILPTLGKVDCCVTDPPYEITAAGGGIAAARKDLIDTEGFTDGGFDYSVLDGFRNWMCFGTLRQVPKLLERAGSRRKMLITWNKPNPCPLVNGNYLPDTEYVVHAWQGRALFGGVDDKRRFIVHRLGDKGHGEHPNEKPLVVMEKLVTNASDVDGVVADIYMGSGTTGVACVRLGRQFIGIEREPKYFEIAVRRIKSELERAPLFEAKPTCITRPLFTKGDPQ